MPRSTSSTRGYLAPLNDLAGHGEFLRRREERLDDRRRRDDLLRADGLRHPRLHLQQEDLRGAWPDAAEDDATSSTRSSTRSRRTATTRRWMLGTADQWEAATMGFQNIGPNLLEGRGRPQGADRGQGEIHRPGPMSTPGRSLRSGRPISATAIRRRNIPTCQSLFTLGQAAIYPAGSWDIRRSRRRPTSSSAPSRRRCEGRRYLLHQRPHRHRHRPQREVDQSGGGEELPRLGRLAGIRRRSTPTPCRASSRSRTRRSRSRTRWRRRFVSWRKTCESTIRNSYQILSRGTPNLENELWNVTAQVINGTMTPEDAAKQMQAGLDSWYKPVR